MNRLINQSNSLMDEQQNEMVQDMRKMVQRVLQTSVNARNELINRQSILRQQLSDFKRGLRDLKDLAAGVQAPCDVAEEIATGFENFGKEIEEFFGRKRRDVDLGCGNIITFPDINIIDTTLDLDAINNLEEWMNNMESDFHFASIGLEFDMMDEIFQGPSLRGIRKAIISLVSITYLVFS